MVDSTKNSIQDTCNKPSQFNEKLLDNYKNESDSIDLSLENFENAIKIFGLLSSWNQESESSSQKNKSN